MRTSVDFISSHSGCCWLLNVDHHEPTQKAFDAKPTARQIRRYKKQVRRAYGPAVKATHNPRRLPEGYEMANRDGYNNDYFSAFIDRGWTVEQMVEQGYLRRIGVA